MRTLIQEEIFRIKEIMGITPKNLISEAGGAAFPYRDFLKAIFNNVDATLFDDLMRQIDSGAAVLDDANLTKLADEVFITQSGPMSKYTADVFDSMRKLSNQFDSYDNKELLELVLRGKNDDYIKVLLANSLMDVEARIIAEFGSSGSSTYIRNFIEANASNPNVVQHLDNMTSLRTTFDNAVKSGTDPNEIVDRLKATVNQQNYSDAVKQYYNDFFESLRNKSGQSTDITNDIDLSNVRIDDEELDTIRGGIEGEKPIEGPLREYLQKKYNLLGFDSWSRLTIEEQNRFIKELSSQINTAFEKAITSNGWTRDLDGAGKIITVMNKGGKISATDMDKIYREAVNKAKPSFGWLGNNLDNLVTFTTGISARQGMAFWNSTAGWGQITKKWILWNIIFAVGEGLGRWYTSREEPTSDDLFEILENRLDLTGLLSRLLFPMPLIPRIIASELVDLGITRGILNYDGFRQLTENQISEKFGVTDVEVKDVTEFPCYDKVDRLKNFKERANYFIVRGENQGVWAYDLGSSEIVQIQTPLSDDCSTGKAQSDENKPKKEGGEKSNTEVVNTKVKMNEEEFKKSYPNESTEDEIIKVIEKLKANNEAGNYTVKEDGEFIRKINDTDFKYLTSNGTIYDVKITK